MRQMGTLTEGEYLREVSHTHVQARGERLKVRRIYDDGTERTFFVWAKRQPLTPTFTHPILREGDGNVMENDQTDFVCTGDLGHDLTRLEADGTPYYLPRDLDHILWGGVIYQVSTASELQSNGVSATIHCLCLRQGKGTF